LRLLVRPRRYAAAIAALVAATGAVVLIVYRCWDVGTFGPIRDMYETIWFEEKVLALVAELVAAVTALIAIATMGPAVIARL
jgi:hypothetical protein